MKLISLFSGIGGFELAAEWMWWEPVVSCEINEFGRKIINYYWPKAYHHDDIHTLNYEKIIEKIGQFDPNDIILTGLFQPKWQNFPTQPPICSRNDGISAKLDGITFSKWRNESIKAYGNAIVPQVAFQIFKAIEKYKQQVELNNKLK